jgi:D-glycero-D-manno-heptose 1,7-bisphosphate phosphatase
MDKKTEKKKAVFLDRDGVINRDRKEYTYRKEDFIFNEGIFEALACLQQKNFLLIVITNQAGIEKGLYTHEQVNLVHEFMLEQFSQRGISITEIYYCPHFGEISNCLCRKPGSLLIEKSLARFDIDPARSFFIGDRKRDMEAAGRAGVKGILIDENQNLNSILHLIP